MAIPIGNMPQTANNFLGPVMQAVDMMVSDVKQQKKREYEEEKRREFWREKDERDKRNKIFQFGLNLVKDNDITPESKKKLTDQLFSGLMKGEFDLEQMQPEFVEQPSGTGAGNNNLFELSNFALRYYPAAKGKKFPKEVKDVMERNAVELAKLGQKNKKIYYVDSSGQRRDAEPMVKYLNDLMKVATNSIQKDKMAETIETDENGNITAIKKMPVGGNMRRVAQYLDRLLKIKKKVMEGRQLTKEDEKWLEKTGTFKPLDQKGRQLLDEFHATLQQVKEKLNKLGE